MQVFHEFLRIIINYMGINNDFNILWNEFKQF